MKSGLVYIRPLRLAYVRMTGSYETVIPEAWSQLLGWVEKNGLSSPVGLGYGLARDNPLSVGANNCRYDACVQVTPLFEERALRELSVATLPGGSYTRLRVAGGYDRICPIVTHIHGEFTAPPNLRLDDRRPIVTIYLDDPRRIEALDLRADICVPVSAARASQDVAQAAA